MGGGILRELFREQATDLIDQGKALLAREATRAEEVEAWQKPALNVLHYLGSDQLTARDERHSGFLEWAGNALSERARKHNVQLTLDALEQAMLIEGPVREDFPSRPRQKGAEVQRADYGFDEERWTEIVEEAERLRLVEEAAGTLGVALPKTIEWSGRGGAYQPVTDTMRLPENLYETSPDEYKALAGHELQHKAQADAGIATHAYTRARGALRVLARELVQPDESLPLHLRATTMLAGASAYATFVLLGKTMGYRQELDADAGGAKAASPEAMIGALTKMSAPAEGARQQSGRGETWLERIVRTQVGPIARALEDDHPSLERRVDRLQRQREHARDTDGTPSR